jgi:hypothetical protein
MPDAALFLETAKSSLLHDANERAGGGAKATGPNDSLTLIATAFTYLYILRAVGRAVNAASILSPAGHRRHP